MTTLGKMYTEHHQTSREKGFSILKEERGGLIKRLIGKDKRVLDIGCRDGSLTAYFATDNDVLGLDVDERALEEASKLGIQTRTLDLNSDWHELEGKKFDAVVAGEVLEHLYYPEKVIGKIATLLAPGGKFIGSVPNAFSLKNRLRYLFGIKRYTPLSDPTHITQFHIEELRSILRQYFNNVEITGLGRHSWLGKQFPGLFGFDLFFVANRQ